MADSYAINDDTPGTPGSLGRPIPPLAGGPIAPPPAEETIWEGRSSQGINFGAFLVCGILCWLIVPIFIALKKYLEIRCRTYTLTNQRLKISQGIFSKRIEDLELFRVKDMVLELPFNLRMFKAGDIVLTTPDHSEPEVVLEAVKEATRVKDLIREHVQRERDRKRVMEVETG